MSEGRQIKLEDFATTATPELFERKLKIQDEHLRIETEMKHTWKSCLCGPTDSRLLKYVVTMGIFIGIIVTATTQLVESESCEDAQQWMGLLTMIIGIIIPTPSFKK